MILVVGSSNTDMVIKTAHLPVAGETTLGGVFFMNPGGKGANQAVAAARLGGNVTFICKTGNDIFGRQSKQLFQKEGINTDHILSDPDNPSGVALITVDQNAENCIVVASGANATLSVSDLENIEQLIGQAKIVLIQLEIPLATVAHVVQMAAAKGVKIVLNPAPACSLSDALLSNISVITPNRTEAEILSGITVNDMGSAKKAAQIIKEKGVETVIITLGREGALILHDNEFMHIHAPLVEAIDTTAAGDVFNGAFTVALSENKSIRDAVTFACSASAISVTRLGAQSSVPSRNEIIANL
ncbi:ribokinase [Pedobacter sp. ok626]|uniref:ribokinase n=1 Tax=Pedobacter sp. ok626 TaxID=1761882 RepID=UPI001A9D5124|nr:ribokinase [Pedobacter sp. ok626]